jgi:1,4-dihydroxy-2-naphthoate octaprenyltransferase
MTAEALPRRASFGAIVLASRPKTLTAAVVPVAVGTACAHAAGGVRILPALAALLGAVAIQIGTNFANDVFDFEKGADDESRIGPTRAVASGLLTPAQMRMAMVIAFGAATLAGVYLIAVGGWPILVVGLLSIASGIAYTGGPFPLGYHGLGDVFVMVFFGFVAVMGTAWVQVHELTTLSLFASVPVGALATAILVVNNLRDRHTDSVAGKRTLAVRFGRGFAVAEYAALLALAYATPVFLFVSGGARWPVLFPLLTLPLALLYLRRVATRSGTALNPLLGSTAKLLLLYGLLLTFGLTLPP